MKMIPMFWCRWNAVSSGVGTLERTVPQTPTLCLYAVTRMYGQGGHHSGLVLIRLSNAQFCCGSKIDAWNVFPFHSVP